MARQMLEDVWKEHSGALAARPSSPPHCDADAEGKAGEGDELVEGQTERNYSEEKRIETAFLLYAETNCTDKLGF